jgi:hypothetical protein
MKKLLATFTLAATSLMVAAPAAHAAPYSFGSLAVGESFTQGSTLYSSGTTDTFSFTLESAGSLLSEGATVAFSFFNLTFDGAFSSVSLFNSSNANALVASGNLTNGGKGFTLSAANLLAGNTYTLSVTGAAIGTGGAAATYAVAGAVSPVPEPESYAMMLAGLAVMGAIARKRSQNKA